MKKSTRHAKIGGDFGESLVLYWLSKNGFECIKVDHTGIDLIAKNPITNERMGISVKCRTRLDRNKRKAVGIDNVHGIDAACQAFSCKPYFAIVVDVGDSINVFITSKKHFLELCPKRASHYWKMSPAHLEKKYPSDAKIKGFTFQLKEGNWWKPRKGILN